MSASRSTHALEQHGSGPYILRPLIADIPLSSDGELEDVHITCVEVLDENLYIGTSAAEILHFVKLPDPSGSPVYTFASRQKPAVLQEVGAGVQQILLLPSVSKVCILCNNTLSFYSLPELSPAFPRLKPFSCVWVGGLDLDEEDQDPNEDGVIIMLCLKTKIRLVRIAESLPNPLKLRDIELGGCLAVARRGDVACVSDDRTYSLLDVVQQQKVPLFPILSQEAPVQTVPSPPEISRPASRSISGMSSDVRSHSATAHGRSTSLNILGRPPSQEQFKRDSSRPLSGTITGRYGFDIPESLSQLQSPQPGRSPERSLQVPGQPLTRKSSNDKALPLPPQEDQSNPQRAGSVQPPALKPHILSPSSTEFLLTTGTSVDDPGVGMFVNLDGDVVRGTLQFSNYPTAVVVDGKGADMASSTASGGTEGEGFVLAVIERREGDTQTQGIEIQRWDNDAGERYPTRSFLAMERADGGKASQLNIRALATTMQMTLSEVGDCLALTPLTLVEKHGILEGADSKTNEERGREESAFAKRLGNVSSRLVVWHNGVVQWLVRNPLVLQLDTQLEYARAVAQGVSDGFGPSQREAAIVVLNDIRGLEARTELEYIGFAYIRQKAALILLICSLTEAQGQGLDAAAMRSTGEALLGCDLDPRIILKFLPIVQDDIVQRAQSIWIYGGLKPLLEESTLMLRTARNPQSTHGSLIDLFPGMVDILHLVKEYMHHWRRKKGFGSVADAEDIFATVDTALLHILLILDEESPKGPAVAGSIRAELNAVADSGIDSSSNAVDLLEQYKRLYILSRLYQSRKQFGLVLATWKRMIIGEENAGGEFTDGELEVRKYLGKIKDKGLVKEYGTWLANRNPKLGVQVFADDNARVRFSPAEALLILREQAPEAVKEYLEHLVFGKKQLQHADELISYYLTIVLDELTSSPSSRVILLQTYETYRALAIPKPTYRDFITDNAMPAEWWHSRLRLLQLLGGTLQATARTSGTQGYDQTSILQRLQPFEQELVPEMIILYGQQQRHEEAIRLLAHGLGDFDTAIRYCLLGGLSLFPGAADLTPIQRPSREEQARLFRFLLKDILLLSDESERMERTSELLERFGSWFDVGDVLMQIPDEWEVSVVAGFVISHLRRLVHERAETTVTRALAGAANLKTSVELIDKIEELGPQTEEIAKGGPDSGYFDT